MLHSFTHLYILLLPPSRDDTTAVTAGPNESYVSFACFCRMFLSQFVTGFLLCVFIVGMVDDEGGALDIAELLTCQISVRRCAPPSAARE